VERLPDWRRVRLSPAVQMELTAIVVMADWIASSADYFPLLTVRDVPPVPDADIALNRQRVDHAWRRLNLAARWDPEVPTGAPGVVFADRFPATRGQPRPVQEAAARLARTMNADGLMIIEAAMGEGKTEAALLAAEVLAARAGRSGCFVALPTQATSNAMFSRVLRWMERLPTAPDGGLDHQSVSLVHGKAALNDEFTNLRFGGHVVGISGEDRDGPEWDSPAEHGATRRLRATVHEWMTGRKRAALSSFVVGTIDQVLFGSLVARHVMLRQLSLASKVVVIDEVHSFDVYMGTFLDRALEWLGASGTPVVLLSATLPAARRADLYEAYERGRRRLLGSRASAGSVSASRSALTAPLGYPSVVTTTDDGPQIEVLEPSGRSSSVTLHRLDDDLERLGALLKERLQDGGNAVVIRNTVTRVQETAAYLVELFGEDAVMVAHAQFLAADRLVNDAELLRRLGPPSPQVERPRGPWIVVASQVVEQSLDVDFDLMVTDVAPVDLLLQRMGRLHRHVRTGRPARLKTPECYLTGIDWTPTPPRLDRGGRAVYGAWPLYRALAVLADRWDGGQVALPDDIPTLVQAAYDETAGLPEGWDDAVEKTWESFSEQAERRKVAAESHALPEVAGISTLYNLSRGSAGAVDEDSPQGQACVRDGGDSVEVVVVQRGSDGVDRIPDWVEGGGQPLPLRHVPVPHDAARALARCTMRLPFRLVQGALFDAVVDELEQDWFEGWQRTPLLSGQLAMVLDDDASRELVGYRVHYDRRIGLVVSHEA